MKHPLLDSLNQINTFVFDVDGVLTDGSVHITEEGKLLRTMNIKDGYAIHHAVKQGYTFIVISGGKSEGVRKRLEGLGVQYVFLGVENKTECLEAALKQASHTAEECLYLGDDIPDIEVMHKCRIAACPKDAVWQIKKHADLVCATKGGKGCVREVIEMVMTSQGKW